MVTAHCLHKIFVGGGEIVFLELINNFINHSIRFVLKNPSWTLWQLSNLSLRQWDASGTLWLSSSRSHLSGAFWPAPGCPFCLVALSSPSWLLPWFHTCCQMSGFFVYLTLEIYSLILVGVFSLESGHGRIFLGKMMKYDLSYSHSSLKVLAEYRILVWK